MQESEDIACTHQPNKADQTYMQAVRDGCTAAADAVDLLSSQYFFTSPKLAALATEAEILAKVLMLVIAVGTSIFALCIGGNDSESSAKHKSLI